MADSSEGQEPQGTTPEGSQEPTQEPQGDANPTTDEPPKADVDWQAEARKWEARAKKDAKSIDDLKQQVKRLVDPDEAQQKVASVEEQLQSVTKERDQAVADALRYRVALEAGISLAGAKRLVGSTEDELRADAEAYLAEFPNMKVGTPAAKTRAGENGQTPIPLDPAAVAAEARKRTRF